MLKHLVRSAVAVTLLAGTAQAGPIGLEQPYFTYSPGAVDFEDIQWTPLEVAAFSAYGGYFANIRRPRHETLLPQVFLREPDLGLEDEVVITPYSAITATFASQYIAAQPPSFSSIDSVEGTSVPEPGTLALVGIGLLAASRSLRKRFAR